MDYLHAFYGKKIVMKRIRTMTTLLMLLLCLAAGCQPEQEREYRLRFTEIDGIVEEEIAKGSSPGPWCSSVNKMISYTGRPLAMK